MVDDEIMMQREAFLEWLSREVPEYLFSQIAAQVLFQCKGCGECCRGEGYALLDEADILAMAGELAVSPTQAKTRFTDPDPQGSSCRILKSAGPESTCIFFDTLEGRCRIYGKRPRVCRTFPMLASEPQGGQVICFYPDCLGTAHFVKMLLKSRSDPAVKRDIKTLEMDEDWREDLKIKLFIWLQKLLGEEREAAEVSRMTGIDPPRQDDGFKRDCLAYFLLTISTEGLEKYRYENHMGFRDESNSL